MQELAGLHCLAAGALQFEDANRALPASDREIIVDHRARDARTFALGRAQHLDAPGRLFVRVRYSRYLTVSRGEGCVARARDGWTDVFARAPGRITVRALFSLSAALGSQTACA